MYYEGCTFDEIRAYRDLESETFDFGEGEMEIDGWYGSEDTYLKMSLPEYYDYWDDDLQTYSNKTINKSKFKDRLNRYSRKQVSKLKLQKLKDYGGWYVIKNKPYLTRSYISKRGRSRNLKKYSNKKVRRYNGLLSNGNSYRKVFDYWWEML